MVCLFTVTHDGRVVEGRAATEFYKSYYLGGYIAPFLLEANITLELTMCEPVLGRFHFQTLHPELGLKLLSLLPQDIVTKWN